jgi:hypothetical protein
MFERFREVFKVTHGEQSTGVGGSAASVLPPEVVNFVEEFGGRAFGHGFYRVYTLAQIPKATEILANVFPEFRGRVTCFAYDWLGRHFALDSSRKEHGAPSILRLEPGTGEGLEIPVNFTVFHESEIIEYAEDVLSASFFGEWRRIDDRDIAPSHCVGYKVPLFLGGKDTVGNLELIDMDVYLEMCGQLRQGTRHLPEGASIRSISIS